MSMSQKRSFKISMALIWTWIWTWTRAWTLIHTGEWNGHGMSMDMNMGTDTGRGADTDMDMDIVHVQVHSCVCVFLHVHHCVCLCHVRVGLNVNFMFKCEICNAYFNRLLWQGIIFKASFLPENQWITFISYSITKSRMEATDNFQLVISTQSTDQIYRSYIIWYRNEGWYYSWYWTEHFTRYQILGNSGIKVACTARELHKGQDQVLMDLLRMFHITLMDSSGPDRFLIY
jgi:hypothetical protein